METETLRIRGRRIQTRGDTLLSLKTRIAQQRIEQRISMGMGAAEAKQQVEEAMGIRDDHYKNEVKAVKRKAKDPKRGVTGVVNDRSLACRFRNGETLALDIDLMSDEHRRIRKMKRRTGPGSFMERAYEYQKARESIESEYINTVPVVDEGDMLETLVSYDHVFKNTELENLVKDRFYDVNVMNTILTVVQSLVWDRGDAIDSLPWNMRFKNLTGRPQDIRDESSNGLVFFTEIKGSGLPLALKTNRDLSDASSRAGLIHEAFVGLYAINHIREYIPSFVYTYGLITGSPPVMDKEHGDVSYLHLSSRATSPYIITEDLRPAISFSKFIKRNCANYHEVLAVLLQILYALSLASHLYDFTHNDLHLGNILIKDIREEIKHVCCSKVGYKPGNDPKFSIPFVTERGLEYIHTRWLAVMIDIGDSHIRFDPEENNWSKFDIPESLAQKTKAFGSEFGNISNLSEGNRFDHGYPLQDSHKLTVRALDKLLRRCGKEGEEADDLMRLFKYFYPSATDVDDAMEIIDQADEMLFGVPQYEKRLGEITFLQVASKIRCLYDMDSFFTPMNLGMTMSTMLNIHYPEMRDNIRLMVCDEPIYGVPEPLTETQPAPERMEPTQCSAGVAATTFTEKLADGKEGALLEHLSKAEAKKMAGIGEVTEIHDLMSLVDVIDILRQVGMRNGNTPDEIDKEIKRVTSKVNIPELWEEFSTSLDNKLISLKSQLSNLNIATPVRIAGRSLRNVYSKGFFKRYVDYSSLLGQITDLSLKITGQLNKVLELFLSQNPGGIEDAPDGLPGLKTLTNRFLSLVETDTEKFIERCLDYSADYQDLKRMLKRHATEIEDIIEDDENPMPEFTWYYNGPMTLVSLFESLFREEDDILKGEKTPSKDFSVKLRKAIVTLKP